MDPQIIVGLLAFVGLIATTVGTQALLHQRWAREQDERRDQIIETQAQQRRKEQTEILDRMAEQNSAVVANAVKLAEVHQEDAEKARLLAITTAEAHTECRQEVASLSGKVEELRARITENERTAGRESLLSHAHQDLKHKALTALTVSEGLTSIAASRAQQCTCGAFDVIADLTANFRPRIDDLLDENAHLFDAIRETP